jgi:hypothetical protein
MILLKKDQYCNTVVQTKNGEKIEIAADQLYNSDLHHWKDWHCYVGVDSIFIDDDYTVYAGNCRNDSLGNLFDPKFQLFQEPGVCKKETCTLCASDLYSTKFIGN